MDETNIVRVGVVMSVDEAKCRVRVKFPDEDITSDWLPVLQHYGAPVSVSAVSGHSHAIHDSYTGGGSSEAAGSHGHTASLEYWMPKVNDNVLCLYLPLFSADGFVLGGIAK